MYRARYPYFRLFYRLPLRWKEGATDEAWDGEEGTPHMTKVPQDMLDEGGSRGNIVVFVPYLNRSSHYWSSLQQNARHIVSVVDGEERRLGDTGWAETYAEEVQDIQGPGSKAAHRKVGREEWVELRETS